MRNRSVPKKDFNESPAGESFSLPAPSIKKEEDSAATSISRQIFIFTLSSAANKRNLDASLQPRLVGESGLTGKVQLRTTAAAISLS